jgi:hypothetical protein
MPKKLEKNKPIHPSQEDELFMPPLKYSSFLPNLLFLLVLDQADYFLFLKLKRELEGLTMSSGTRSRRRGRGSSGV